MFHYKFDIVVRPEEPPLVVDLDGTLLRSDILLESGLALLRDRPLRFPAVGRWLVAGKARLKDRLAQEVDIDVATLPYNPVVIDLLTRERQRGRKIVLATASHESVAVSVAEHLMLFDEILASSADLNLSGAAKNAALVEAFGEKGFDYLGNATEDLHIWRSAREAYVVNASSATLRRARQVATVVREIKDQPPRLKDWMQAIRLHQWVKNVLVFVPLLGVHRFDDPLAIMQACLAFFCFGCCASSAYILNDLLDLKHDRHHAIKRNRPFASGALSIQKGVMAAPMLLVLALWIAFWDLPPPFLIGLVGYYVATLAYSLTLKRMIVVDVVTLAILYTTRIVAGGLAIAVPLSFWLLALSMFMFFSLAMAKRYAELHRLGWANDELMVGGRGYCARDLPMLATLGSASGYMTVMVLALYINDDRTAQLYHRPELIWLACPILLAWMSRVWILAGRGQMNEDPVVFAVRDRASQIMGLLCLLVFAAAI